MIETRLLHYFLAVAREQTITRAAETLHLTQSTLSKQMMDLERQLGKQLFIRGKRRLTLMEEGNFLRHKAQEILELIGSTESAFHTEGEILSGDITIGCGETAAMDRIAAVYQAFHRQHPEVRLHTFSGDAESVLERLDRGLVDMGLLLGPIRQERFDYLNIHQKDTFGLLMPRDCPLAGQDAIGVEQLGSLLLILSKQTFSGRQEPDWFGVDSSALSIVATYNLVYNATFLVERGIGYALCLEGLVNTQGRDLTFRPIEPELSVGLYIATKKYQTFSPAVKAFLEQVREAVG